MPLATHATMPKTTAALETSLLQQLDRLAGFDAGGLPVLSLYLDMRADDTGRPRYDAFLRKAFDERAEGLDNGPARDSYLRDVERIQAHLANGIRPAARGLAVFACHGADLFEAIELEVPLNDHALLVSTVPHLYPLARVNDQYPRYAALLLDTNRARLFVFALGTVVSRKEVQNVKTKKTSMGGWSQARYQRHNENFHQQHMKEVVSCLDRVVRDDAINHIVLSCDEVSKPLFLAELPPHLTEKLVDLANLGVRASEHEVLTETLAELRARDAETDAERVNEALGAWRAGGLGVAGPEKTTLALEMGQVEELLIPAQLDADHAAMGEALVTKAQQTAARVRFIEDPELLRGVGGCAAILRFKV